MTKYGNKKITLDGIEWDSLLEGAFYQRLKDYKKAGKIHDFRWKIPYVLHGANGIAICKYKLDFEIEVKSNRTTSGLEKRCVEVKGYFTAVGKLKKKLFEAEYGKLEMHYAKEPWVL